MLTNVHFSTPIGNDVVLGPSQSVCIQRTSEGVPIEQAIGRQRLRPGSGILTVRVSTDGPTRVLQVMDISKHNVSFCLFGLYVQYQLAFEP